MKKVLTIAGSDCSGGAGIQADLKTMTMNGVYGMSAILALTAQNTLGVKDIHIVPADFLKLQLDMIFEDIVPDAIKIGMVSSKELICVIADRLTHYQAKNIVLDPVMVSTSGSVLLEKEAISTLKEVLMPKVDLLTPNILEAELLSKMSIHNENDMLLAAQKIYEEIGTAVLVKGGHSINDANDLLYLGDKYQWFMGERIDNPNTHGTGCTLSSAIASNLAKGHSIEVSIKRAKQYISKALLANLNLGKGRGPMKHNFDLQGEFLD